MKSYKTTIIGAILAAIIAVQPLIETGSFDLKKVALAAFIALFGYLAKDSDVTGTK